MLKGKIALVTGAAKGIGRAMAVALAKEGATVVVNYNGSKEKAEAVVEEIRGLGTEGCAYQCNVADTDAALAMIKEVIAQYGRLDILVNNAGITRDNLIMKMTEEDFDAVISANLKGCFNTIKGASRQMLKQRSGRIINITSVSGILGNAGQANYDRLCGFQGRHHRPDQNHGQRTGQPRDYSEWSGARVCGHRYDPGAFGKC